MNLFYAPGLVSGVLHFILPEEESSHVVRSLRMKNGDSVFLTNGSGMYYEAEIINPHPEKCEVKIIREVAPPASGIPFRLSIAIAPTKSIDRFEWLLEKVTELGCSEIIPITCKHSERTVLKTDRLKRVLLSAMKQCLKCELPQLHEMISFKKFVDGILAQNGSESGEVQKFIGHIPELSGAEFPPANPRGKMLHECLALKPESRIIVCIGPEGGFSEEEAGYAVKNGFVMISLGNSRLRVETAGVAACAIINAIMQGSGTHG